MAPFLVADIDGTHARIGLVAAGEGAGMPELLACRTYCCADHPHLAGIVRSFVKETGTQPEELVLACAGYLHAGKVINQNLAWPVAPAALAYDLRLQRVSFLNDFEASAHAVARLAPESVKTIKDALAPARQEGPIVVIGPGAGLGAAVWFPGRPPRVLATEAGQMQLAARVGIEQQLLARLAPPDTHLPCEAVLSEPGLHRLYTALCAMRDRYPACVDPAAVLAAARAGDELAHEALNLFFGWLGSFAADLAVLHGAAGGVYLAGSFFSRITTFMRRSPLVERFLDKGVMRPFLHKVPIHVVDQGQLGVIGAASWYRGVRAAEGAAPEEGETPAVPAIGR